MSTLASVMNSALKSLMANQLALSVRSNNIANAGTPGYTRQQLVVAQAGHDGRTPAIGMGVDVIRVQAIRDSLIETRLRQETSAKSGDESLSRMLRDVEVLFNDHEDSGLLPVLTNFFNSFHTLSLDPASMNFREEVKVNAEALISALRARNADLTNIKAVANNGISSDLDKINQFTKQIASLSREIAIQEVNHNQAANDLRDQRSELVRQLSEIVAVNELDADGNFQLSAKNNVLLVFGGTTRPLTLADITPNIGEGSLKAKLDVRDTYVPKYLNALDQIAYEVVQQINTIHASAYNLDGGTGVNFFATLASAADASRLIDLNAVVAADTRKIAASQLSTGNDNQKALQMANLLHNPVFTGGSITDQYRSLVFSVGSDLSAAEVNLREHSSILHQLTNRRQSISGVNIDEETVQILQFQRSYEASAKLLRTVDELLQVALSIGGSR
jgi:flagellar hook-associated protein 1 FlgK